jgi:hypothetical protein
MPVESTTLVARADNLPSDAIDQDLVILNLKRDDYVALDAIGRRIWELIASPRRVDELCQQLSQEFDGPPEQIAADTLAFLNELEREEMLNVVDAGSA